MTKYPSRQVMNFRHLLICDTIDISSLARFNKGYKFLVTCIDVFSKFTWVVPLNIKTGESLVNGFQPVLDLSRCPEKLQTDKGTEFLNRNFQSFLIENSIHFFTTSSELKATVVERFNRTLKTHMWKYFTAKNTHVFMTFCRISCKGIIILIIEAKVEHQPQSVYSVWVK